MLKTLIITNHYIDINSGGSLGSISSINIISEIVPECYLIYPDSGKDPYRYINKKIKLIPCSDPLPKWLKGILVYFGRLHRFTKTAKDFLNKENIDLIVFDTIIVSHKLIVYAKRKAKKIITIHHGVEKDFYKDNKPHILIRIPFMLYLADAEKKAVFLSDMNLVPTSLDKQKLMTRYKGKIKQNKIQILSVYENPKSRGESFNNISHKTVNSEINFIITGSLSFPQSDVCIRNFLTEYIPVIRKIICSFKIIIAGRNPSEKLLKIAESFNEVTIIKNPENMNDILRNSDVYLCPVYMGSGIKLRIMDGLKSGLPVLAHKESSYGYEKFIENQILYMYDSPESFEVSLRSLLNNKLSSAFIINLYKEEFSFDRGEKIMKSLISNFFDIK